jgi:integrase
MRFGEALGLTWGCVEFAAGRILVRQQLCSRTGELAEPKTEAGVRFVQLPDFVVHELKVWKLACPKGRHELVLPNREGGPLDQSDFRNRCYLPAVRRAGLRRLPLHNLRHGYASMLLAAGTDLATLSQAMGHANIAITLSVYSHWVRRRSDTGIGAQLERFLKEERAEGSGENDSRDLAPQLTNSEVQAG